MSDLIFQNLTVKQKIIEQVNKAIEDADNGRYFTQKESEKLFDEWLEKRVSS